MKRMLFLVFVLLLSASGISYIHHSPFFSGIEPDDATWNLAGIEETPSGPPPVMKSDEEPEQAAILSVDADAANAESWEQPYEVGLPGISIGRIQHQSGLEVSPEAGPQNLVQPEASVPKPADFPPAFIAPIARNGLYPGGPKTEARSTTSTTCSIT